jgi:hypothetical protein
MLPFCESAKMAALPLNKFPCSKTAAPPPETTGYVLTSLPSPFYKSHCSSRLGAVPSFPQPAWQFGPAIKLCSMDVRLFSWSFFQSAVFLNICFQNLVSGWVPSTDLTPPTFLQDLCCFTGTPNPKKHHSLTSSQGSSSTQCASNHHPLPTNLPSRSSFPRWVLFAPWAVVSLSHFLENCSTRSQLTLSLGTGFPTRDCVHPSGKDVPSGCCVPHFSLSPEDLIFRGCCHISPQVRPSPWELNHPKFLQTPHWDVSRPTLGLSA